MAAAGASAPLVVRASALGAQAPSERLPMGLIGVGKMCQGHLNSMLGRGQVHILAVCDVQAERRDPAKARVDKRYGNRDCDAYTDFRRIVERDDIEAVMIATPDHWHALTTIRCAESGKDVYCEKPLSLTIREARAMVNAVRRYGRVFQTGSQQRSWDNFRFACEMVQSGRCGTIHTVHVNVGGPSSPCYLPGQPVRKGVDWDLWLGPAPWRPFHETVCPPHDFGGWPQWRRFRDYSGGGMTDMGAHHFDIAQWGLGTDRSGPVEIVPPDGKKVKWLTYKYASGVVMHHGGGDASIHFKGTDGEVMVGRGDLRTDPPEMMETPIGPNEVHLYNSRNHHQDWLDAIRLRKQPVADVEIGARSVSVCHLGNIAYKLKRRLRWDPDREVFLGDAEANRELDRPKRGPWRL
jgi:predicted dehydrogenase